MLNIIEAHFLLFFKMHVFVHPFPSFTEVHRSCFKHSSFLCFRSFPSCLVLGNLSISDDTEKVLILEAKPSASWHQTWDFFSLFEWDGRIKIKENAKDSGNVIYWDVKTLKVKKSKSGRRSSRLYLQYSQVLPWLHQMNFFPSALDSSTHHLPYFKLKKEN